ncbi:hypothetical protein D3C80_1573600 [compost metagenome]
MARICSSPTTVTGRAAVTLAPRICEPTTTISSTWVASGSGASWATAPVAAPNRAVVANMAVFKLRRAKAARMVILSPLLVIEPGTPPKLVRRRPESCVRGPSGARD